MDIYTIEKCAELFKVSIGYLLGDEWDNTTCPECGLAYIKNNNEDIKEHNIYHEKFMKAKSHFPELINSLNAYIFRSECENIIDSERGNTPERFKACEGIITYYFSRSLRGCGYSLQHVPFKKYAAMLLNQKHFKERFGISYEKLCEIYGTKAGLDECQTYYVPNSTLGQEEKPANSELLENVIIYHRDGKTVEKQFTKEEMDIITTMIDSLKGVQTDEDL